MDTALVIRGNVSRGAFVAAEPVPDVDASAELIVYTPVVPGASAMATTTSSIFDLFGQAEHLRSGAEIDAQVRDERAWGAA